ncbi:MAG: hypothetical protein Q9190_000647 [Brigantiaea leucoxantha]
MVYLLAYLCSITEAGLFARRPQEVPASKKQPPTTLSDGSPAYLTDGTRIQEGQQTQTVAGNVTGENGVVNFDQPGCNLSKYCWDTAKYDLINIFRGHLLDIGETSRYLVDHDIACHTVESYVCASFIPVPQYWKYCLFGQGSNFPGGGITRDQILARLKLLDQAQQWSCGCIPLDGSDMSSNAFLKVDYVNHAECEGSCLPTIPDGPRPVISSHSASGSSGGQSPRATDQGVVPPSFSTSKNRRKVLV